MKKIFFLLIVLWSSSLSLAQSSASLSGRVTDERGEPLIGITILLEATDLGTATDLAGNYRIENIPAGEYTVIVSGIGYETQRFALTCDSGAAVKRAISMQESTALLADVVVTAESEKTRMEGTAQAVQVLETKVAKLQSADLGDILAKTEGVNVQRGGGLGSGFRFALNGLSGDQIRFFYDGVPLDFSPYGFGIANVPVNMIDRIEVYKGVVPVQFGADALGGAVNLVPPGLRNGYSGSASYQLGSFGTHRVTANLNYADEKTGLFVAAGGFFDYTDNNYRIDVAVSETREDGTPTGRLEQATVERFHDAYRAYGGNLRLGIRDKKWANELSLEGYYGNYNNEIQNSQQPGLIDQPALGINQAVAGNPFGGVLFTSYSAGLNLDYNVDLHPKWELDLKAGYNYDQRVSVDTSRNLYNWFGEVIRLQNVPGELGIADHLITESQSLFARQQLTYQLSDRHAFKLSVAPTHQYRTADDLLIDGPFDPALDEGFLFDLVSGLEYTADLLDGRLQNIAFAKNYRQSIRIESLDPSLNETLIDERVVNNYGAGNGLRYDWSDRFSTKLSYEFAYRLPRQDEIFGDGQLILENLALRPESSHNVNLQASYRGKPTARIDWQVQGNFFLRRIDDLIFLLVNAEDFGAFQNVWSATSRGIEWSGRVRELLPGLSLSANTTYQAYFNTSDDGPFAGFAGDRIPNTPYFFANGAAEYELLDVLTKQDCLSFFYNVRYVNAFFIGWESAGLLQFKAEVPSQTVHAAGLTYRLNIKNRQHALTVESQNLTDAKVFDLFGVQRPGRAFFVKLSTQF
ncbi:MAG: carboxypeptidase-like regulatory domain-containing protein [Bacteroidota bacterium]